MHDPTQTCTLTRTKFLGHIVPNMPRTPKNNPDHPLRLLRAVVDKSQADIAKLLGVSPVTIKRIENAYGLKLSNEHRAVLAEQFGVEPGSLINPKAKVKDIWGRPYTSDSWAEWQQSQKSFPASAIPKIGHLYAQRVAALLLAGKESGSMFRVLLSLQDWFTGCYEIPGVKRNFNTAMHALTREPVNTTTTFGDLRADKSRLKNLKWPEKFNPSAAVPVVITGERFVTFFPPRATKGEETFFETVNFRYEVEVRCGGKKWRATFDKSEGITFNPPSAQSRNTPSPRLVEQARGNS